MQVQKAKPGYKLVKTKFRGIFEIPYDWELQKFGDSIRMEYGSGLTKDERSNEGYPVYGSGGVVGHHSNYLIKGPGIVVARKGSLGNVFYAKQNFWPIDTVYYITNKETKNDLVFLYYFLQHYKLKTYAIVTAQPGINREEIYTIFVKIPPIHEQQKIVAVLFNMDSLIQQYDSIIKSTKKLKTCLMQQLLTKGIDHTKFKKIKWLFGREIEIPAEWELTTLQNACKKEKNSFSMGPFGSDIKTDNFVSLGIPVIRGINLTREPFYDEEFVFLTEEKADELKSANSYPNDLIFTHRGTLGQVGVIPKKSKYKRYIISQSQMKCTCDEEILDPMFAYYFFHSNIGKQIMVREYTLLGVPHISQPLTTLRKFMMLRPKIIEQQKIVSILSNIDSQIIELKSRKSSLEILKKGLMQKLLTGELRVRV